jgi:murein DD-endopeptidase MepM/ murein hydrolase activator NlpD
MSAKRIAKFLLLLYMILLHFALGYLLWPRIESRFTIRNVPEPESAVPLPSPVLEESPPPTVAFAAAEASPTNSPTFNTPGRKGIIIPVQGIKGDQLVDTYAAARSSGRTHDAIDIMAPEGTPVLAAVDGEIARFFDSIQGGITIYQFSEDKRFVFYYAHLQSRSDLIKPGDHVTQGTVIGYVGNTGNAGPNNFHLHFSIARITDPAHFWHGEYINPYPLLKSGTAPE